MKKEQLSTCQSAKLKKQKTKKALWNNSTKNHQPLPKESMRLSTSQRDDSKLGGRSPTSRLWLRQSFDDQTGHRAVYSGGVESNNAGRHGIVRGWEVTWFWNQLEIWYFWSWWNKNKFFLDANDAVFQYEIMTDLLDIWDSNVYPWLNLGKKLHLILGRRLGRRISHWSTLGRRSWLMHDPTRL